MVFNVQIFLVTFLNEEDKFKDHIKDTPERI